MSRLEREKEEELLTRVQEKEGLFLNRNLETGGVLLSPR